MGLLTDFKMPSIETLSQISGEVISVHEILINRARVVNESANEVVPSAVASMQREADKQVEIPNIFTGTKVEKADDIKNEVNQPLTTMQNERSDRLLRAKYLVEAAQNNGKQNGNADFLNPAHHDANIDENPAEALTLAA